MNKKKAIKWQPRQNWPDAGNRWKTYSEELKEQVDDATAGD